tara:strand:+ start:170 stop:760 length:591 start_codon:yes stop_codon:yes gene_type:complete
MLREITTDFADYSSKMKRSTPGEGMANDPDNPYPFESAPEFTVQREALEYLFTLITEEERYADILIAINNDVPIMELTQVMLFKGFTEGKWNPDLMMLLAEPLAFMLIALAERQGIDYVINNDDDEEEGRQASKLNTKNMEKRLKEKQNKIKSNSPLPPEITQLIEEAPIVERSLLNKPEEPEEANSESLLAQQGV